MGDGDDVVFALYDDLEAGLGDSDDDIGETPKNPADWEVWGAKVKAKEERRKATKATREKAATELRQREEKRMGGRPKGIVQNKAKT